MGAGGGAEIMLCCIKGLYKRRSLGFRISIAKVKTYAWERDKFRVLWFFDHF